MYHDSGSPRLEVQSPPASMGAEFAVSVACRHHRIWRGNVLVQVETLAQVRAHTICGPERSAVSASLICWANALDSTAIGQGLQLAAESCTDMQICNLMLFIAINGIYLRNDMAKLSRSVFWINLGMWTCWNTVSHLLQQPACWILLHGRCNIDIDTC